MLRQIFLGAFLIINFISYGAAEINITMDTIGSCSNQNSFKIGDVCQFSLTIYMSPTENATAMHIELYSSDNSSLVLAQICKPTIQVGSNYNTSIPIPVLTSDLSYSQFDQATIDFDKMVNSGVSLSTSDNQIVITFSIVVIQSGISNGTSIWITGGVEYYDGEEIWISQTSLTYLEATPVPTPSLTTTLINSGSSSSVIGGFSSYTADLMLENSRYTNISLVASSNSTSLTVCSIHIQSTGTCFSCLDSVKAYIFSSVDKVNNIATFNLGNVPNTGFNLGSTTGNSKITIFVTYFVASTALISNPGSISLVATLGSTDGGTLSNTITSTFTPSLIYPSDEQIAPTLDISADISSTPISIYQAFNIPLTITFPATFNNLVQIEAIPNQSSNDGLPRVKMCSVAVISSGENLPCPKCINNGGVLTSYSQNSTYSTIYDSFNWQIGSIRNYNLRNESDNQTVNQMILYLSGQILNHPSNIYGTNLTIPIGITFGNQTIWVSEAYVIVGSAANYSNTSNTLPTFSMSIADNLNNNANIRLPRAIYFDIYTKPGSVYMPMNVEVIMPETFTGSNVPAATVCSVQILYNGIYSGCVQKDYINDMNNNKISYLQRMVQFKKDKAIISLPSLCNSANPNIFQDPVDGLIRFLIYFQLDDNPQVPTTNYISVGVQYTNNQIFIGEIVFYKSALINTAYSGPFYAYSDNVGLIGVQGGSFVVVNYVLKIKPQSNFAYNLITNLQSSTISNGNAAMCNIRITKSGKNIPCINPINQNFVYSNNLKNTIFAYANQICSINNASTSVNSSQIFDDDSVNFEVLTRPSYDASGTYSLSLNIKDNFNNNSLSGDYSYNFSVTPNNSISYLPDFSYTFTNITGIDPADPAALFSDINLLGLGLKNVSNYLKLYKGQTSIVRYLFVLNEPKVFDISFQVTSNFADGEYEIQNVFVANIGDNLPCTTNQATMTPTFSSNGYYPSSATLNVNSVAYYPTSPSNVTASILTIEILMRIPLSSNIVSGTSGTVTIQPLLNNIPYPSLSKSLNLQVDSKDNLNSNVTNVTMSLNSSFITGIKKLLTLTVAVTFPPNSNVKTLVNFKCVDWIGQFANIKSLKIVSMGRNINGLMREYNSSRLVPYYYTSGVGESFYKDSVDFDLGIITNTNMGTKQQNYVPYIDDNLVMELNILTIDNDISVHSTIFNIQSAIYLNSQVYLNQSTKLQIQRTGNEMPILNLNASFINQTSTSINSGSTLLIRFDLAHDLNSTAEAYNVQVVFYFPVYVQMKQILLTNSSFTFTVNDSAVFFLLNRLHFDETAYCIFSVIIDPDQKYSTYINNYGSSPNSLQIPFNALYKKFFRNLPIADINTMYYSNYSIIEYVPQSVGIVSTNTTSNKLLGLITQLCQFSSSVSESIASNVKTSTGWLTGFRSYYWYKSMSTYVTIEFEKRYRITSLQLSQLPNQSGYTPFLSFAISFSNDGFAFATLPEVTVSSASLGTSFAYTIPNSYIDCKYLRIHLTDVVTQSDLSTKTSGVILNEIYGSQTIFNDSASTCATNLISNKYTARSILYANEINTLYVCDETVDRISSECYSSTDMTSTNWQVFDKIVATIVFWVRDLSYAKDYLYGVGKDKLNYVRSDDNGLTWKAISEAEFTTMLASVAPRYIVRNYVPISYYTLNTQTFNSWKVNYQGVWYGTDLRFDWFN